MFRAVSIRLENLRGRHLNKKYEKARAKYKREIMAGRIIHYAEDAGNIRGIYCGAPFVFPKTGVALNKEAITCKACKYLLALRETKDNDAKAIPF